MRKLLDVLERLVDPGNTVVVIEHNLDVIKSADWVDRPGTGGRATGGGRVVASGTPETGSRLAPAATRRRYLRPLLADRGRG